MYKLCKSEQSAMRQRSLEQGLLRALSCQHYEDITVSSLCQSLIVPRKSFYRYFDSKEGALQALLDHTLEECIRMLDAVDHSVRTLECFFLFWQEHRLLLDALSRSGLSGLLVQRTIFLSSKDQSFIRLIQQTLPEAALEQAVLFISSGLMSIVINWHHSGFQQSPAAIAGTTHMLLTNPLLH